MTISLPLTRQLASRHARLRDTLPHRALGPGVVAAMGDAVHGGAAVAGHLRLVLAAARLLLDRLLHRAYPRRHRVLPSRRYGSRAS